MERMYPDGPSPQIPARARTLLTERRRGEAADAGIAAAGGRGGC
ncbi:hypothetical protein ACQPYK_12905 [Streptosporangium sp. CA-135522]